MAGGFGFVVNNRSEILLIQRGYGKQKGKWSMPGGGQDEGESLRRTAIREVKEETGISMSADALYFIMSRPYKVEVWRGRRLRGRLKVQKRECLDGKWFPKDMLPHHTNLAFRTDKKCLDKWAAENHKSRRVHYPRSQMGRAGFLLVVNHRNEILLIRRKRGSRLGKWSLPGDRTKKGESRSAAAKRATYRATGVKVDVDRLYYENRHKARIYLGKPGEVHEGNSNGKWFNPYELPKDEDLAFAVDVRTVEKWASENK